MIAKDYSTFIDRALHGKEGQYWMSIGHEQTNSVNIRVNGEHDGVCVFRRMDGVIDRLIGFPCSPSTLIAMRDFLVTVCSEIKEDKQ